MSEMTQSQVGVPAALVEMFNREIRNRVRSYAEGIVSEATLWAKWADEGRTDKNVREDADRHLDLTVATFALADQIPENPGGPVRFEGSAWVLSDVADAVLIGLIDRIRSIAFTSPVEYGQILELAERVKSRAAECSRIDRTYREGVEFLRAEPVA
ncbi:MAG TPA: hypothetical protein PKD76_05200 [Solirubrobacterales bacterium]|nr:hypothetical protein [Solirubrobacterales bacterium]